MTQLDYVLHKQKVWLHVMPESKRNLLEKHPLLAVPAAGCRENKAARQNAMKFYNHLDVELMPMDVAKALGPGKARVVIKQLGNEKEPSSTQKIENEKNAKYINTHSDILPKSISVHLPHNERQNVVERLKLMKEISLTDPPGEDKYLLDNPGMIPIALIDLLTQSERKEVIEKLILRKKGQDRGYLSDKKWLYLVDRSSVVSQGFKGNEGATNGSQSLNEQESSPTLPCNLLQRCLCNLPYNFTYLDSLQSHVWWALMPKHKYNMMQRSEYINMKKEKQWHYYGHGNTFYDTLDTRSGN